MLRKLNFIIFVKNILNIKIFILFDNLYIIIISRKTKGLFVITTTINICDNNSFLLYKTFYNKNYLTLTTILFYI